MANTVNLTVGGSISMTSSMSDGYGVLVPAQNINYVSADNTIATLANSGTFVQGTVPHNTVSTNIITGVRNGITNITITVDGVVTNIITVIVKTNPVALISTVFGTASIS